MFLFGSLTSAMLGWLMGITSVFLIMLVLVQRGRGGGLAGALGGPGGQSAFGSKAGDTFTTITIGVAIFWGLICAITILVLSPEVADVDDLADPAAAASVSSVEEESALGGGLPDGDAIGSSAAIGEPESGEPESGDTEDGTEGSAPQSMESGGGREDSGSASAGDSAGDVPEGDDSPAASTDEESSDE